MTGGGARGAYQAGVLKRIGQIKKLQGKSGPFKIIGGASAGAVNGAAIAAGNHDFARCVELVAKLWSDLENKDIYRTDLVSLIPKSISWLKDLSLGGMIGGGNAQSLLDATPLNGFLNKYIKTDYIQNNIDKGHLRSICISTTNYSSGKNILFIQAEPGHKMWTKSRRMAIAAKIEIEHICASAAIPIVFGPVKVETEFGADYFGDGCLRLHAPLSPVIRLGAERILAIGLRSEKSASMNEHTPLSPGMTRKEPTPPPLAQILGVTLNAIFLDHLDADVEHLFRLNQIISQSKLDFKGISEPIKIVHPLVISPSFDLGKLAAEFSHKLPTAVHYLMSGLGTDQASSSDLVSYLLFDSEYTKALINMGYADADGRIDEIENFIFAEEL
jgi:NTE family protein